MKNKYDFVLTPAYCLFNGVAVKNQNGCEITFLINEYEKIELRQRLERAFRSQMEFVLKQSDCPEEFKGNIRVDFIKGSKEELKKCISSFYAGDYETENNHQEGKPFNSHKTIEEREIAAAVILLDTILSDARKKGATDIHIQNNEVKFRVHGKLEYEIKLQKEKTCELIQRIKVLGGLNVVESRKCQDGHFVFNDKEPLYVRVSCVPLIGSCNEAGNESVVLRLLDDTRVPLKLNCLGYDQRQLEIIREFLNLKNGLVLVCGSTGSGKSTTIASILTEITQAFDGGKKIISLEDPPEYVIKGVTQIEIDEVHGNGFEETLNHIFRQDPDVLMIGEIRDELSAKSALRASLTGHLVFATLHTSSAAMSLLRLENLGLDRKLVTSVLKGVIVQELGYVGNNPILMADIAKPGENFSLLVDKESDEEQIDKLFIHTVNSRESIMKSLSVLKEKSVLIPEEDENLTPEIQNRKKKITPVFRKNSFSKKKISGGNLNE